MEEAMSGQPPSTWPSKFPMSPKKLSGTDESENEDYNSMTDAEEVHCMSGVEVQLEKELKEENSRKASDLIPQFYFPSGKPICSHIRDLTSKKVEAHFSMFPEGINY